MLRSLAIGQLGRYADSDTITDAQKRFSDHCPGARQLSADLKVSIFYICLANGDKSTFEQLLKVQLSYSKVPSLISLSLSLSLSLQLHDATDCNEERVRIYHSLGNGSTD